MRGGAGTRTCCVLSCQSEPRAANNCKTFTSAFRRARPAVRQSERDNAQAPGTPRPVWEIELPSAIFSAPAGEMRRGGHKIGSSYKILIQNQKMRIEAIRLSVFFTQHLAEIVRFGLLARHFFVDCGNSFDKVIMRWRGGPRRRFVRCFRGVKSRTVGD